MICLCPNGAVLLEDLGSQKLHCPLMQVRRPLSDPAAAGPCKVCLPCPCKKTSQKQKRGAQSLRKRSLHTVFFRSFHSSGGAHSSPTRLFRQGSLQSPPYPPHRKSSGSLPARPPLLSEPPPRSWEERHFWNPGLLPFRKAAFRRESDILPPVLSHPASLFTVCITLPFCSRSAALFRLFNRCPSRPTGQAPSRRAETARRCRRN